MPLVLAALAMGPAMAQGRPQDREEIQRALMAEALRSDLPEAIARYQTLVRTLPDSDPNWTVAVLSWARALYDEGAVSDARDALRMATRKGRCTDECQALLQHIALDEESIRVLPVEWSFDNENPGLFHHWSMQGQGELVAQAFALHWTTNANRGRPDRLVVGFDRPDPPPREVAFEVRSLGEPSWVRLVLEDEAGQRFVTATVALPADEDTRVVAELATVRPDDATSSLVPGRLSRVSLQDLTGSRRGGQHTVAIRRFIATAD